MITLVLLIGMLTQSVYAATDFYAYLDDLDLDHETFQICFPLVEDADSYLIGVRLKNTDDSRRYEIDADDIYGDPGDFVVCSFDLADLYGDGRYKFWVGAISKNGNVIDSDKFYDNVYYEDFINTNTGGSYEPSINEVILDIDDSLVFPFRTYNNDEAYIAIDSKNASVTVEDDVITDYNYELVYSYSFSDDYYEEYKPSKVEYSPNKDVIIFTQYIKFPSNDMKFEITISYYVSTGQAYSYIDYWYYR